MMNKETIIKVETALGETEEADIDDGIGQGGVESGILSAKSLDGGVTQYFSDHTGNVFYGKIEIKCLLWQDDVMKVNGSVKDAQDSNKRMEAVLSSKMLSFNEKKSVAIVIGSKKSRDKIKKELEESPLMLCNKKMKMVETYSYLGEVISEEGVGDSALKTVSKRCGIAYKAIFEIKAIIEDTRSKVPGAFMTAEMIWKLSVLPALLNSAECWTDLPKQALDKLNRLQETYYQVILNCPVTSPKPGLYWFTGGMMMMNHIIQRKLLFLWHLFHLDGNSLGKEVLETQRRFETGFWTECLAYMMEMDISLEELENTTKMQWKSRVKLATKLKNKNDLLKMMEPYKKLDSRDFHDDEFETKSYFHELTLSQARTKFSIDIQMLKTVKSCYPSQKSNEDELWECSQCCRVDSIRHLYTCPGFSLQRMNKKIWTRVQDLVTYMQEIIEIRMADEQAQKS